MDPQPVIFLFLARHLRPPKVAGDDDEILHVEAWCGDMEAPLTPVVMQCGVSCVMDDDGNVVPDEVEWVLLKDAKSATCRACRAAVGLPAAG